MQIIISAEQVALLRELVVPMNLAHLESDCEPPGFSIVISFVGPFGSFAMGQCGSQTVDLGEVEVQPIQGGWSLTDDAS